MVGQIVSDAPVLSESEMCVKLDGEYLGECCNPSYRQRETFLTFEPGQGAIVDASKECLELPLSTKVALPQGLGHINLAEFCGDSPITMSESDFVARRGKIYRAVQEKINFIIDIAHDLTGTRPNQLEVTEEAIINEARQQRTYRPERIVENVAKLVEEKSGLSLSKYLSELDFYSLDRSLGDASISLFYLYNRLRGEAEGFDAAEPQFTLESLQSFPAHLELMEQYNKRPDGRFGDTLLWACGQILEQQKTPAVG